MIITVQNSIHAYLDVIQEVNWSTCMSGIRLDSTQASCKWAREPRVRFAAPANLQKLQSDVASTTWRWTVTTNACVYIDLHGRQFMKISPFFPFPTRRLRLAVPVNTGLFSFEIIISVEVELHSRILSALIISLAKRTWGDIFARAAFHLPTSISFVQQHTAYYPCHIRRSVYCSMRSNLADETRQVDPDLSTVAPKCPVTYKRVVATHDIDRSIPKPRACIFFFLVSNTFLKYCASRNAGAGISRCMQFSGGILTYGNISGRGCFWTRIVHAFYAK
jgi:hypothetical protein